MCQDKAWSHFDIIAVLIDCQFMVSWGTDNSNAGVLDFITMPYTIIVSYCHLNYIPGQILGMVFIIYQVYYSCDLLHHQF